MKQIGSEYEHCISSHIEYEQEMLPFCSSVTSNTITDPRKLDASYWRQNLESPVLFTEAIQSVFISKVSDPLQHDHPDSLLFVPGLPA